MGLCEKCAQVKTSCCINREIFITEGDIERISQVTGKKDFFEYRKPVDLSYLDQEDDDPNWNDYTVQKDQTRRVIKHQPGGRNCFFLTEKGCTLDYSTRPLLCRLFPYIYNEEKLTGLEHECPVELLEEGESFLLALSMDEEAAELWRKQLYNELVAEKIRKQYLETATQASTK